MAKEKQTANEAEKSCAENATKGTESGAENVNTEAADASVETLTQEELDNAEVPEDAEEIAQEEALEAAASEVNRLREENTVIKQELDAKSTELKNLVEHTNKEAEIAGKQILELEAKVKELETQLQAAGTVSGSNQFYIELLNKFEGKIDEYAGLRRERLRKEFITDLKEEINKQREQLTNA